MDSERRDAGRFLPSRLGFGCASLGSRIGPRAAMRRIREAIDLGVTHFDVAPSYGRGLAEEILGRAVQAERDRVTITTKFGIRPTPPSGMQRLILPLARWAAGRVPAVRRAATGVAPARPLAEVRADGLMAGLTDSLRRLRCGHVDVFCLHEVPLATAIDPEILEALDGLKRRGLARRIGLAGDPDTVLAVAARPEGAAYDVLQFADSAARPMAARVRAVAGAGTTLITHGAFHGLPRVREAGNGPALLLRRALAANPDGCTLCSMVSGDHLAANAAIARAAGPLSDEEAAALRTFDSKAEG